jgi:hypothetical protein
MADAATITTTERRLVVVARWYLRTLLAIASAGLVSVALILLGLSTPGNDSPIVDFIRSHPAPAITLILFLILLTVLALRLAGNTMGDGPGLREEGVARWQLTALWVSTATSAISLGVVATLLVLLVGRPDWCPSWVCVVATRPDAVSDGTLEVYPAGLQTGLFALSAGSDPATMTSQQLPSGSYADVAAVPLGSGVPTDYLNSNAYRINIGIHNQRANGLPLLIEHVRLRVVDLPPTPSPLNVYSKGSNHTYSKEPFHVTYGGEPPGTSLEATFTPQPGGLVQLVSGEADALTLEVHSLIATTLRYTVDITYRVSDQGTHHTIAFPLTLTAVFSSPTDWRRYQLSGSGHLVPLDEPTPAPTV